MIIDNHVHVGWFTDGYHSPKEIWVSEMAAGVDGMAVASTSTCAELYKDVFSGICSTSPLCFPLFTPL